MPAPPPAEPAVQIRLDYNTVVDAQFLQRLHADQLGFLRGDGWISTAGEEAVPGEVLARADYHGAGRLELLLSLAGALVHLVRVERAVHLRVAAGSQSSAEAAIDALKKAMPLDRGPDGQVPVSFWWWNGRMPEDMGRLVSAPPAEDLQQNYSRATWTALESMTRWTGAPPAGGRLVLWHGTPGTGKTTAVRALARSWREWADFHFITDPELFLATPSYMLNTLSARNRSKGADRWRVIVLEDAGEFLAPDAKQLSGQSLSRLLNVCDGVLGQATQSILMITTNEHLRTFHPAVSRPGRCLAAIEFHELGRDEIVTWCEANTIEPPSSDRAALAGTVRPRGGTSGHRETFSRLRIRCGGLSRGRDGTPKYHCLAAGRPPVFGRRRWLHGVRTARARLRSPRDAATVAKPRAVA